MYDVPYRRIIAVGEIDPFNIKRNLRRIVLKLDRLLIRLRWKRYLRNKARSASSRST